MVPDRHNKIWDARLIPVRQLGSRNGGGQGGGPRPSFCGWPSSEMHQITAVLGGSKRLDGWPACPPYKPEDRPRRSVTTVLPGRHGPAGRPSLTPPQEMGARRE